MLLILLVIPVLLILLVITVLLILLCRQKENIGNYCAFDPIGNVCAFDPTVPSDSYVKSNMITTEIGSFGSLSSGYYDQQHTSTTSNMITIISSYLNTTVDI